MCTYVIKVRSVPEILRIVKSFRCSEHEVISAKRMRKFFTFDDYVTHDLWKLKIKTRKPALVASKLFGKNAWTMEHQGIVFQANPNKN